MTNPHTKEAAYESVIENHLLQNGYVSLPSNTFDRERAIFGAPLLDFIRTSQPKAWARLEKLLGEQTGEQILRDLCKWLEIHGVLATLRHGFKCYGRKLFAAQFAPVHRMNPDADAAYAANTCGLTRQLYYSASNTKSLDLVLSLNGIPLMTVELKNQGSGQTVNDAVKQYRKDRDPRELIFKFKARTLVHFAADTDSVQMTTRLAGSTTYFLPFNRGNGGGAGNPRVKKGGGYRTAYLWEEVLQRDSFLDLVGRFIHLQTDEKRTDEGRKITKETMIFPRYHQLGAVRQLVTKARADGPGNNYLVEHSAGSGKSNTIGWLAHRLASLHTTTDTRVFDSVVVITDRRVLDKQLQQTIYQFEHKLGVVEKIDKHSRQLAEALVNGTPIIITTLQKFPFVTKQLEELAEEGGADAGAMQGTKSSEDGVLPTRRFAVIIDEAHSSQGGETAADLKQVLGGQDLVDEAKRRAAEDEVTDMDELYRNMAKRGRQANVSFFAFTATPKHKTYKIFGEAGKASHRYTMRQAIEEGFILDVLKNYTTYATYFKLVQKSGEELSVDKSKAARALAKMLRTHPYNIAQKTQVMVEHFNAVTKHKIGGRAKAMVVTGSRLEAVRYKEKFDEYIRAKGYEVKSLVAFSGVVNDDKVPDVTYTEVEMNNGIKERELPEKFASPEYHVLLVAEKYQTGFDQPLLHTMYVDKRLAGIQAVQTLSRLNRNHPLKEDTFVLDFVNDREEIKQAFSDYYEGATIGEEADPAALYRLKLELEADGIITETEVDDFAAIYFRPRSRQSPADHRQMNEALDPAVTRFAALLASDEPEAEQWRGKLASYRSLYGFLSQVLPYQDGELEKLFVYLRYLSPKLPRRKGVEAYDFDDDVRLEYYRLQKISEGSITLAKDYARPLDGPTELGVGMVREPEVALRTLIDRLNDRFGTDFNPADQLFFDQMVATAVADEEIIEAAAANPKDKFKLIFEKLLRTLFSERIDQNEEIFARYMNDGVFHEIVTSWLADTAYDDLRQGNPRNE